MTSLALTTGPGEGASDRDFVISWTNDADSVIRSTLGPDLTEVGGPVPSPNIDLVRIAAAVTAADKTVLRRGGGSDWNTRDFAVDVTVREPDVWSGLSSRLSSAIGFLTGDRWSFTFSEDLRNKAQPALQVDGHTGGRHVLFSGGADSASGAIISAAGLGRGSQTLVSHFSTNPVALLQKKLAKQVSSLIPSVSSQRRPARIVRGSTDSHGVKFASEPSSRSRSLLYISLGLAFAAPGKAALWMPENGFASLNPPLNPGRRGALSTRTTHPRFLVEITSIVSDAGGHADLENPFQHMTKGEVFQQLKGVLGGNASDFLSSTHSCAHTDARFSGISPWTHCGVCFGCLVRRAAFHAAGIEDKTMYVSEMKTDAAQRYVRGKSIVGEMLGFAGRPVTIPRVVALGLPDEYDLEAAADLCSRGARELDGFLS